MSVSSISGRRQPPRFIPERFREARLARGLTKAELARRIDVTRQALTNIESGSAPSSELLMAIARELRMPIAYFGSSRPAAPGPSETMFFRGLSAKTKRQEAALGVKAEWVAQILGLANQFIQLPPVNLPHLPEGWNEANISADQIEDMAMLTRRTWGLGDGPIGDIISLLEANGVAVARLMLGFQEVDAFSCWFGSAPAIFLSDDKASACRSRFDAAHELGHLVLHRWIGPEELLDKRVLKRIEAEANRFASAFLMPAKTYPLEVYSLRIEHFVNLKKRWKTSVAAQGHRCFQLGLFDDDGYLNFRKQLGARRLLKREPLDDEIPLERPRLISAALKLIMDGGVRDPSSLVNEIGLSPEEIEELCSMEARHLESRLQGSAPVVNLAIKPANDH